MDILYFIGEGPISWRNVAYNIFVTEKGKLGER